VTIESKPGQGTVVTCLFPMSRQLTQSAA